MKVITINTIDDHAPGSEIELHDQVAAELADRGLVSIVAKPAPAPKAEPKSEPAPAPKGGGK